MDLRNWLPGVLFCWAMLWRAALLLVLFGPVLAMACPSCLPCFGGGGFVPACNPTCNYPDTLFLTLFDGGGCSCADGVVLTLTPGTYDGVPVLQSAAQTVCGADITFQFGCFCSHPGATLCINWNPTELGIMGLWDAPTCPVLGTEYGSATFGCPPASTGGLMFTLTS